MTSENGLTVHLFSLHGLIRAHNLELGRDADTGGQITYVTELADHLSRQPSVRRVVLFTRLVSDKRLSDDYGQALEAVDPKFQIVRIQCGGKKYLRKERLWPHLNEYTDKTIKYIKRTGDFPDVVHGHYPDAGFVAMELASIFGLPFVYTGHSLGRDKKKRLAEYGMSEEEMIRRYKIDYRIRVEESIFGRADRIVASTHQEVRAQYGAYRNGTVPLFEVIPPGIDIDRFYPFYHDMLPDADRSERAKYAQASMMQELNRFFMHPDKPLILALCRPDKRKNISGLIRAFGEDSALKTMANLAVFAGLRKDIDAMADNEREVLTRMLLLMDKYDLYGKLAIPKKHDAEYEVPALYRIAAETRGVFVNPALTEPFGLTLLEASATGVPIVATNDGGPNDIVKNCDNGILVDATDPKAIAGAIKRIITEPQRWDAFSKNGILNIRKHYTWDSHAQRYLAVVSELKRSFHGQRLEKATASDAIGRRLACLNHFIVADIDNTLIGEDNDGLEELVALLNRYRDRIGFAVATGRSLESAADILATHGIPAPDVMITSVGSELYYGPRRRPGRGWAAHIAKAWNRDRIVDLLRGFDFLEPQEKAAQRPFKISYNMTPGQDRLARIHQRLTQHRCRYNLIYSHSRYLDILPWRASKGKALRYLGYKWEIPLRNFLVCGDSGNDEEMLRGEPRAVVVGNHAEELNRLKGRKHIHFAESPCAGGILEGIRHYRFLDEVKGSCR